MARSRNADEIQWIWAVLGGTDHYVFDAWTLDETRDMLVTTFGMEDLSALLASVTGGYCARCDS